MNTPKEIYIATNIKHPYGNLWNPEPWVSRNSVKYIRADLAELTWKDIKAIAEIGEQYMNSNECFEKENETDKEFYSEILRRYKEYKER